MGLGRRLRNLLRRTETEAESQPHADALRELSTAAVRMEEIGYTPLTDAALCFETDTPAETVTEIVSVIEAVTDRPVATAGDQHGYRWLVVSGTGIEDLATGISFAVDEIDAAGYGDRLLAAVAGFADGSTVYLIYSFGRKRFYPFVPTGTDTRDHVTEIKLRSLLAGQLPIESDESEWYPLWPDRPGLHPWETSATHS